MGKIDIAGIMGKIGIVRKQLGKIGIVNNIGIVSKVGNINNIYVATNFTHNS